MTHSNQVACKRFIDDVAVQVVETSLLAKLGDIFSPLKVTYLAADVVKSVAGESDESRAKRKQLMNQLDVLVVSEKKRSEWESLRQEFPKSVSVVTGVPQSIIQRFTPQNRVGAVWIKSGKIVRRVEGIPNTNFFEGGEK